MMDPEAKRRRVAPEGASDDAEILDAEELDVKKCVKQLERSVTKNMGMRAKFPNEPEKFVDSEVDLDDAIQRLTAVTTSPQVFAELLRLQTIDLIIGLLAHENDDICSDTVQLLSDLFAQDDVEQEEQAVELAEAFLASKGNAALADVLVRFKEDDEGSSIIFTVLSIFENLIEMKPEESKMFLEERKLRGFLLQSIHKERAYNSNKQYCAELLAMLAQNNEECQKLIAMDSGLDDILESIATIRKQDPDSEEEKEMILDLFNILCSCMFSNEIKDLFFKAEGIELMLRLVPKKKWVQTQCLKLVDFSISRRKDGCMRLMEAGGLGIIFAFLMKADGKDAKKLEEIVLSIILELLIRIDNDSRERVEWKLKENSYEKIWRIINIFAEALEESKKGDATGYTERLDAGLYRAQLAAQCIAFGAVAHGLPVVETMLSEIELTPKHISDVIEELKANNDEDSDVAVEDRKRYQLLQDSLVKKDS